MASSEQMKTIWAGRSQKERSAIFKKIGLSMKMKTKYCVNGHLRVTENMEAYTGNCKVCARFNKRRAYKDNPYRRYGINLEDYNNLLKLQSGVCAICALSPTKIRSKKTALYVDHSHVTNQVRGLLCHYCNAALGYFKDDIALLQRAIKYLENSASNHKENLYVIRRSGNRSPS